MSIGNYESAASAVLPASGVKAHLGTVGAPTWETNTNNIVSFKQWVIRPRILTGVCEPRLETMVLGQPISLPVLIAPAGGQQRFHACGECAMARGAARADTIMVLSTMSSFDIEETRAAAVDAKLWFQLYVMRNRTVTAHLVKRAEAAGYRAIVLTVDNVSGHLPRSARNDYAGITGPSDVLWPTLAPDRVLSNFRALRGTPDMPPPTLGDMFDASFAWTDIAWLRNLTRLPIIIKGVQTAEDAQLAVAHGIDAIIVSNHGGTPAALDMLGGTLQTLREVHAAVRGRIEVYVDGGIRHGADVLKALALGARAVLIGRASLWGLTVGGESGVADVLDILRSELSSTMCIAGIAQVDRIAISAIAPRTPGQSALS